nr:oligosaccharide flippase family protein [Arthrobacter stackebrandtii]
MTKLWKSPSLMTFSRLCAMGLSLASAPIIARSLGPSGRGLTAAALAALIIVPLIISFGYPMAVRRHVARHGVSGILNRSRLLLLVLILPSWAIGLVLSKSVLADLNTQAAFAFVIAMTCSPLAVSWILDSNVLIAQQRFGGYSTLNIVQPLVSIILIILAWITSNVTVEIVIWAQLGSSLAAFIVGLLIVPFEYSGENRVSILPLIREGFSYSGSQIAEAASQRVDSILLLGIIGPYGTGIYSVAFTVASLPLALTQAVSGAIFKSAASNPDLSTGGLAPAALRASVVIGFASALTIGIASPLFIPFLFGPEFLPAVPIALLCLGATLALSVGGVASNLLAAFGKGWVMTAAQVGGLAINILLIFLLAPLLDETGAAIAKVVGCWVCLAVCLTGLRITPRLLVPGTKDLSYSVRLLLDGDSKGRFS